MKNPCEPPENNQTLQAKLAGLGESSVRKTYYPALQQRMEELERFQAFLDHSNDIFFLVEVPSGKIVDVNESATVQTGWEREEFLTASLFDISELAQCPEGEEVIRSPRARERALVLTSLFRKDGGKVPAELTLNRMLFHDKTYVLAVARDITERKKLEEQLLQSQKMEALGQLAGGVAHDFNNILMVIMGYAEMLKGDPELASAQKDKVAQILESSEKAAELTKSLLTFSRKQVMKPRTSDLNDIINRVQRFLVRIIGEDVRLKSAVCSTPLFAEVDAGQIEQVLVNLATNARDAMPNGGTLSIETTHQVVDDHFIEMTGGGIKGHHAVISVSDTGVGMDEKTRLKIFEPFFTTKDPGKGTGLGMAIVYGIVSQHNGFIHVYSEPGVGTTFRVYLPLVQSLVALEEEQPAAEAFLGGGETLLVAEDEPALRKLLETLLTEKGYSVVLARDGKEAVELFRRAPESIDLVLMDVVMPNLSGKEAGEAIRAIDAKVPLLYTSGYTRDIIVTRDILREGTELVMKPVQPRELLKKVREMLDRKVVSSSPSGRGSG